MEHFIQLVGLPLLSCVIIVGILSYLGIHVLKREIIFVDIALAQMAVVGAIIAHLAFHAHGDSWVGYACGVGAVVSAAAFYSFARKAGLPNASGNRQASPRPKRLPFCGLNPFLIRNLW